MDSIDLITNLFEKHGCNDYIGEPVSKEQHMLQCAYFAKQEFPEDEELIVACLLHDIGHLIGLKKQDENEIVEQMGGVGTMWHETIGRDFLKELKFSERICECVSNHVLAKRYLCAIKKDYYTKLSDASKKTLTYQGGVMKGEELEIFKKNPFLDSILLCRKFDEMGKVADLQVPDLNSYIPLIQKFMKK